LNNAVIRFPTHEFVLFADRELDLLKEAKADALTDARLNNEFLGRGFADLQVGVCMHRPRRAEILTKARCAKGAA
jgi:hypothetical protein